MNHSKWMMASMLAAALVSCPSLAAVKLPAVLSSHMVLQRGMPVPIWGTAAPGESVTVKFRDQVKTAVADKDGRWLLKLDPLAVGEPAVLSVNELNLEDVVVGEVWLGSGQSNMDMPVSDYIKGDEVLARAATNEWPEIRLLRQHSNVKGDMSWQRASPATIPRFSALLFSFGVPLQDGVRVPVGLLVSAVGGTPSGYWLSEEAYNSDAGCREALGRFAATYDYDGKVKQYQQDLKLWEVAADAVKGTSNRPPVKPIPPQKPGESPRKIGNLYEQYIRPCIPYAIRGVLWDQGESGTAIHGLDQCTLMGALIRGWRKDWGQGDFPFVFMQKPSGGGCAADPADPVTSKAESYMPPPAHAGARSEFNRTAENHIRILQYTNTAMVFCSDLGAALIPRTSPATVPGPPAWPWVLCMAPSRSTTGRSISRTPSRVGRSGCASRTWAGGWFSGVATSSRVL